MTNGKLRLLRAALATLVLGGGCGGDEEPTDSHAHDAGDESDSTREPRMEGAPSDADASAAGEPAAAARTIEVSDERLMRVALDFCKSAFACDMDEAHKIFADEADCREEVQGFWRDDIETSGDACGDAQLDLYTCYATASCEDQLTACPDQEQTADSFCPDLDEQP